MEIKLIPTADFMQLLKLTREMHREINPNVTDMQSVNTLMAFVNAAEDFLAVGLYDDGVLVGIVTGNRLLGATFFFTGLYLVQKSTEWTKKLIDFSFDHIRNKGYTGWEVDSTNDNVGSIMEKYGASVRYVRYRGEFK